MHNRKFYRQIFTVVSLLLLTSAASVAGDVEGDTDKTQSAWEDSV